MAFAVSYTDKIVMLTALLNRPLMLNLALNDPGIFSGTNTGDFDTPNGVGYTPQTLNPALWEYTAADDQVYVSYPPIGFSVTASAIINSWFITLGGVFVCGQAIYPQDIFIPTAKPSKYYFFIEIQDGDCP